MSNKRFFIEDNIIVTMLLFSTAGLFLPHYFLRAKSITYPMLILIAFCVGLTLKTSHFNDTWKNKRLIIPTLIFKYITAPFITFFICKFAHIPILYTIGLVTLTSCPAANTGNIMCHLSRGNTAMIIVTTITGSLLASLVTPAIIYILLHKIVHIDFINIIFFILNGITIPMMAGIFLNYYFSDFFKKIKFILPSIGVLTVSTILAAILAQHANQILHFGIKIPVLCTMVIILLLSLGFLFSKAMKCEIENAIAMSFEIGTFDGVLGILLTTQIAGVSATLPVIIFAVLNLIIGSIVSKIFTSTQFTRLKP